MVPRELARLRALTGDMLLRVSTCSNCEASEWEPERERDFARARALEVMDSEIERMSDKDSDESSDTR